MTTYIVPECRIFQFYDFVICQSHTLAEQNIRISILGLEEMDIEQAKTLANVGDCLVFNFNHQPTLFQVIHKFSDGRCAMQPFFLSERRRFDLHSNNWQNSEIRKYLNSDYLKNFDPELIDHMNVTAVNTDNYYTFDRCWLPSHEELGYSNFHNAFIPNSYSIAYDYYAKLKDKMKISA